MTPSSGRSAATDISPETLRGWFTGRLPEDWFVEPVEVTVDRDEITIVGRISEPTVAEATTNAESSAALAGRIRAFREQTRHQRMAAASEAEHSFDRKVSWGVRCGPSTEMFTTLAAPVMTRLRQAERQVLDTLVASGVARSRSEALSWCVALVGRHEQEWLDQLRSAMSQVDGVRAGGPRSDAPSRPERP